MKQQLILFLSLIALPFAAIAQQAGTVFYQETTKITITFPEDSPMSEEEFRKMVPSERITPKVLYFNEEGSVYQTEEKDDADNSNELNFGSEDGGVHIRMVSASANSKAYHDFEDNQTVTQQDFMGKTFLITGEAEERAWKITSESKKILDYTCRKATMTRDDKNYEVWFTTELPVPTGPTGFINLPGMVLEASVKGENQDMKIVATKVDLETSVKDKVEAPDKGKKVTREEFEAIREEKLKEMQDQNGGGNRTIRIIRN